MITFGFLLSWLGVGPTYQLSHHVAAWRDASVLDQSQFVGLALAMNVGVSAIFLFVVSRPRDERGQPVEASVRRIAPWLYLAGSIALTPMAIASASRFSRVAACCSAW
jgi:hypothetical protein